MLYRDNQLAVSGFAIVLILFVGVVAYIIQAYLMYKAGEKAKYKNSYFAWIPLLNTFMLIELAGLPAYYMIGFLIPYVNIALSVFIMLKFYSNFGLSLKVILISYLLMMIPVIGMVVPFVLMWDCAFSGRPYQQIKL